jgi:cytochrome c biogenesis factor
MNGPQLLLVVAAGASLLATGCFALGGRDVRLAKAGRGLLAACAALLAAAFLFLLSRFIVSDLSYEYVFLYSGPDLALRWRIAGTWAGRQGSLLLWTLYLAVVASVLSWRWDRASREDQDGRLALARRWSLFFVSAFLSAFTLAVVAQDTFAATPDFFLQGRPEGNGLNPTLKSDFILIHPPLMFLAYALTTVPAAAALAHLLTGSGLWSSVASTPSRLDWLLYTLAMGLGGLWAYYTLGFGGYWAWDPVEVANLLPWLALTVYLHAQLHHRRYGSYAVVGPFLAMLPLLLTLFSAISTRSGLWVSVHAFTDPSNTFDPDAAGRFLDILDVEPGLRFYVALWLASLAAFLALWCRRLAQDRGGSRAYGRGVAGVLGAFAAVAAVDPAIALAALFEAASVLASGRTGVGLLAIGFAALLVSSAPALLSKEPEPARARRLDLRSLAYYSIVTLGLVLLLLFLLHMATTGGWSTGFYLERVPWLATPIALGLLVLQGHGIYGRTRSLQVAAMAWAAACAAALAWPGHRGGAYLTTLGVALLAVGFDRLRRTGAPAGTSRRTSTADALLLLAALLDVAFWLNPPSRLLGPLGIHLEWPIQLPMGALALYCVWGAHRILVGAAPRRSAHVYWLTGLLGAYYVAPVLAAAAWLLRTPRPSPAPLDRRARAALHQVALYGIHFTLAVALVGYAPSSHLASGVDQEVALGSAAALGPYDLRFTGTLQEVQAGTPYLAEVNPELAVERDGRKVGQAVPVLRWEPSADAHFPLPTTVRFWERDLYVSIDAIHAAEGACGGERWIEAYQGANPPRLCAGDPIDAIQVDAVSLPMLGLVWAALFLFVGYMGLLMATAARSASPGH